MNFLINNSKLDVNNIRDNLKDMKRKEILARHPYKIWQGTDTKWYTYLPDKKKGRVLKKRKTLGEVEDIVIEYIEENEDAPTIKEIFYLWLNKKLERDEIEKATYSRYERDFERYFKEVSDEKVKDTDEMFIENFVKDNIHKLNLTNKAYSNMRTLVYGIFTYARKCKYITYNVRDVVADIDFSRKEFKKVIHEDDEEVFMEDEKEAIVEYLIENQDPINLGLLFLFGTGLRIGELCVLKRKDISDTIVSVHATETIYKDDEGNICYDIKDSAKTPAGVREVLIPNNYSWVAKKCKSYYPFSEYIFMNGKERIKSYQFRQRLYYVCTKLGIKRKSPHKVRKTYGTILLDSGAPKSFIIEQMGHTDISCVEKHYYFNRKNTEQKKELIDEIAL